MIPAEHVLLLAIMQFIIGLAGVLVRRSAMVVLVSGLIMLNSILLVFASTLVEANTSAQTSGVVILVMILAMGLVGSSILFVFHRFRRAVALDEHDRMKH